MKNTIRSIATLTAAGLCLGVSAQTSSAAARQSASPPEKTVDLSDLNVLKPSGAQTLYQRIDAAARDVCLFQEWSRTRDMRRQRELRACYEKAIADAVDKINQPQLASLHRAKQQRATKRQRRA